MRLYHKFMCMTIHYENNLSAWSVNEFHPCWWNLSEIATISFTNVQYRYVSLVWTFGLFCDREQRTILYLEVSHHYCIVDLTWHWFRFYPFTGFTVKGFGGSVASHNFSLSKRIHNLHFLCLRINEHNSVLHVNKHAIHYEYNLFYKGL